MSTANKILQAAAGNAGEDPIAKLSDRIGLVMQLRTTTSPYSYITKYTLIDITDPDNLTADITNITNTSFTEDPWMIGPETDDSENIWVQGGYNAINYWHSLHDVDYNNSITVGGGGSPNYFMAHSKSIVYAGRWSGSEYWASTDGGKTFGSGTSTTGYVGKGYVTLNNGTIIWLISSAGYEKAAYRTDDTTSGSFSFANIATNSNNYGQACISVGDGGDTAYAWTSNGNLYTSTNGSTWTNQGAASNPQKPVYGKDYATPIWDYVNDRWILTPYTTGQVYESSDGKSWNLLFTTTYPPNFLRKAIPLSNGELFMLNTLGGNTGPLDVDGMTLNDSGTVQNNLNNIVTIPSGYNIYSNRAQMHPIRGRIAGIWLDG